MSGEKTEQPTEKRLRDSKRKGQVARSQDLSSAFLLIASIAVLTIAGAYMAVILRNAMREGIVQAVHLGDGLESEMAFGLFRNAAYTLLLTLAPLFAALFILSFLVNYLQVGSIFAPESVKPNLNKLNPVNAFKEKFFKSRPYIELLKTILKIVISGFVSGSVLWNARFKIVELTTQSLTVAAGFTFGLIFEIGFKVGVAFLVIAAGDFFLQRFLHRKEMKMSKHEVKEEYKETEGNPLIKGARRQIHYEILSESMQAAIQKSDVVLVNPTHVAVALQYDRETMGAPVVVAKGADLMAAQIRRIADEAEVPIMRNIPLARSLYELEIDDEISEDMFEAVAEVLRLVYELEQEARGEVKQLK